jgi:multidrug efflux pump
MPPESAPMSAVATATPATSGVTTSGGATSTGGATGTAPMTAPTDDTMQTDQSMGGDMPDPLASEVITTTTTSRRPRRPANGIVRLHDVARIELHAQNYNQTCKFDGKDAVGLSIYQLPGTNALEVGQAVRKKMRELKKDFPEGVDADIGYDTTPYIRESVDEVFFTLGLAVVLVAVVVLAFLQDWRTMILPMIDVPVSLIGTFAVMALLGFSLNNISLFGLVLAIGIVVDDAIVVLENIERLMATGLDARTATIKAMEEVTGPIIAVALVLSAVFVPCAFIPGITGQFFRQFAVTISVSTVISAINAITMTPSRAVLIFKAEEGPAGHKHKREALPWWIFALAGGYLTFWLGGKFLNGPLGLLPEAIREGEWRTPEWLLGVVDPEAYEPPGWLTWGLSACYALPGIILGGVLGWVCIGPVNRFLGRCFRGFNRFFDWMAGVYARGVGQTLRHRLIVLLIYAGLLGLTWRAFQIAPQGFIPQQDQGRVLVSLQLPDSSALERTQAAVDDFIKIAQAAGGVKHIVAFTGMSFVMQTNGPNFASMFLVLEPFHQRQSDQRIMARIDRAWKEKAREGELTLSPAAPIPGLGLAGGYKLIVEDQVGGELGELQKGADALVEKLKTRPALDERSVRSSFRSRTPQLFAEIDRTKAAALGVPLTEVNQTLAMFLGSVYVNSFNDFGRHWQVTVQAEGRYRTRAEDVNLFRVRNNQGQMVPLGTLVTLREITGPLAITRYNLYTAASISGNIRAGVSTGEAIADIKRQADEVLPRTMKGEWTELMFIQTRESERTPASYIFFLSVVCVFLALAALYESWTLPLAVILVVPLCLLCSIAGVLSSAWWSTVRKDVNIFVQIGLVVLVGLACKNAILIVEYARQLHREGKSVFDATVEASRLRLRPILMTSFAFILGVAPLLIASGAGAEMRQSLGTAVFSGMLGVTLFGIFLTPVFFHLLQTLGETRLFAGATVRWLLSCAGGGLVGATSGYLLGQLGVVDQFWGPVVGAALGLMIMLAALEIRRRARVQ